MESQHGIPLGAIGGLPLGDCLSAQGLRTGTRRTDEDHAHAIDGGLSARVGLAILVLELVDSALQRGDVALQLLDDLLGRHDV